MKIKDEDIECPYCDLKTEKVLTTLHFFDNTITIDNVNAYKCPQCGLKMVTGEEHNRIGKKVDSLRKVGKEQKTKQISVKI